MKLFNGNIQNCDITLFIASSIGKAEVESLKLNHYTTLSRLVGTCVRFLAVKHSVDAYMCIARLAFLLTSYKIFFTFMGTYFNSMSIRQFPCEPLVVHILNPIKFL